MKYYIDERGGGILSKYKYNLKKDVQDERDYLFFKLVEKNQYIPESADLRNGYAPIEDQGKLGACTSFSACSVMEYLLNKNVELSKLFFYYQERKADGDISEDEGSTIRQSAKIAANVGTCREELEPYDIEKFTNTPSQEAYDDAPNHKVSSYHRITTIDDLMYAIGVLRTPVLIGCQVYESFEQTGSDGYVSIPDTKNEQLLGAHAINLCGYFWKKTSKKSKYDGLYFIARNSWSEDFADKGYMYIPAQFIQKFSSDWWYLQK